MYSVVDYGTLIADKVRMGAFVAALRQVVRPGAVVIDIGTGTGIFASLACSLGARRVYAIEPNDAIEVARSIAAANGFADRIEFHHAFSTDVTLPEQADVIVADIGGMLPWFGRAIPSIVDARRRLLAPGGVIVPQRDVVWTAVVEVEEMYSRQTDPWSANEFGLDMKAARDLVVNTWMRGRVAPDQLLAPPKRWTTVDYAAVEDSNVRATVEWTVVRGGVGHGLASGFDRTVADGVELSNAPDRDKEIQPTLVYEPVFFPWTHPVALEPGDVVSATISATLVREEYVWSWRTRICSGAGGAAKAAFDQSTFLGTPLCTATLKKHATDYVPSLTDQGRLTLLALTLMADRTPAGEIARRLRETHPARFPRAEDALAFVGTLASQYA
jgi:protein arginine N-methyltransferase 1